MVDPLSEHGADYGLGQIYRNESWHDELRPDAAVPGAYTQEWGAVKPGSYVVETVAKRGDLELGRDVVRSTDSAAT